VPSVLCVACCAVTLARPRSPCTLSSHLTGRVLRLSGENDPGGENIDVDALVGDSTGRLRAAAEGAGLGAGAAAAPQYETEPGVRLLFCGHTMHVACFHRYHQTLFASYQSCVRGLCLGGFG
jgi:hypothetical protein